MGNSQQGGLATQAVQKRGVSKGLVKHTTEHKSNIQQRYIGGRLPPLHVIRDCSVQTEDRTSVFHLSSLFSLANIIILASFVYFGLCYIIICSNHVQSIIVYSHYVKEDLPLRNLITMGLPEAKNIDIITEDGILLRGWHLMPPGAELLQANKLPEDQRDLFFDEKLAHSERIVIYFHGNSQTRGQGYRLRKIKQLALYLRAHVIAFDYRGFADSDGYPSEAGTHIDARAVLQYVDNIVRRYNHAALGYLSVDTTTAGGKEGDAAADSSGILSRFLGLLDSHGDFLVGKMTSSTAADPNKTKALIDNSINATLSDGSANSLYNQLPATQPHLFLYGHSLGAAVSVAIAVEVTTARPGALSGVLLDCPFTALPDAIRHHPLTNPFRAFPWIFQMMVYSLQFHYPNIARIRNINAPLMMIHAVSDIKIHASHSRTLYLRATNATTLVNESDVSHYGRNTHIVQFARKQGSVARECSYPVEFHTVSGAGHNEVYATREWLSLVPTFAQRAEEFVLQSAGVC